MIEPMLSGHGTLLTSSFAVSQVCTTWTSFLYTADYHEDAIANARNDPLGFFTDAGTLIVSVNVTIAGAHNSSRDERLPVGWPLGSQRMHAYLFIN